MSHATHSTPLAIPNSAVNFALAIEFLAVFVLIPAAFALRHISVPPLRALWAVTFYCIFVLSRQRPFDLRALWKGAALATEWRSVVALFACAALLLALLVRYLTPELFLNFPRQKPWLWILVLLLYPPLSVVPQTFIYRTFLNRRYRRFLPSANARILLSGVAFAWLHIVLRNPLAPLLTLPAGLLFAWRYERTGSMAVSAFEHSLYGCLIFTVGLGQYFYTSAAR